MSKIFIAIFVFFCFACSSIVQAEETKNQINNLIGSYSIFLGNKKFNNDWTDINATEIGLKFDGRMPSWPVGLAVDILNARPSNKNTSEFNVGIRASTYIDVPFTSGIAVPLTFFAGSGVSFVKASSKSIEILRNAPAKSDTGTGPWFDAGIAMYYGYFSMGFEAIYSSAKVNFNGNNYNAGGNHFGCFIRFNW